MLLFSLKGENGDERQQMYTDTMMSMKAAPIFLAMPEALPWHTGYVYEGHTLKRKDKGWLLVVRASREDSRLVSFWEGGSPTECARHFAFTAVYGDVDWKKDKWH